MDEIINCYGVNLNEMSDEMFRDFADGFFDEDENQAPTTKQEFKEWIEDQDVDDSLFREGFYEFIKEYEQYGYGTEK